MASSVAISTSTNADEVFNAPWLIAISSVGLSPSINTDKAGDGRLAFPAPSVVVAVIARVPGLRGDVAIDQFPAVAVPVPTTVPSAEIVTVAPASAVPIRVGVVTFVMLSVDEKPESDTESRSGVEGGSGAVVSVLRVIVSLTVVDPPATSVTRNQTVLRPSPDVMVQAGAEPATGVKVTLSFEAWVDATPEPTSLEVTFSVTAVLAVEAAPPLIAIEADGLIVSRTIVSAYVVLLPALSLTW